MSNDKGRKMMYPGKPGPKLLSETFDVEAFRCDVMLYVERTYGKYPCNNNGLSPKYSMFAIDCEVHVQTIRQFLVFDREPSAGTLFRIAWVADLDVNKYILKDWTVAGAA